MYLSSFSLVEPEDKFYFYQPSWLNAWEAHLFNKALKSTHANGWGLKRFGTQPDLYPGEMIRNPHYQKYLEAMEKAADGAADQRAYEAIKAAYGIYLRRFLGRIRAV